MNTLQYNINKRPFDTAAQDHLNMYDHLPYQPNRDICNKHHIQLFSGNLIKPYSYALGENLKTISNHDDEVVKLLHNIEFTQHTMSAEETDATNTEQNGSQPEDITSSEEVITDENVTVEAQSAEA